jgi:hypothetical protein
MESKKPTVSLIIPTYNRAHLIFWLISGMRSTLTYLHRGTKKFIVDLVRK